MAQATQQQVNYRPGNPNRHCGLCTWYYIGPEKQRFGRCTKVKGRITPYGICEVYRWLLNPFAPQPRPMKRKRGPVG
jgi:hypothetical protein